MKTREQKQKDLTALTEQLGNSKSAMVVSFSKVTVNKDQELRNQLREAGAQYQVVKNTIARLAVKGTQYEGATEHFKGVSAIAWTENDPVVLSKAISKFLKENADLYTFKAGVVDGRVLNQKQVESIANLPSKEELMSKLLWVINAQAQRLVTVINAVPRNLAVVIKQIGDQKEGEAPVKAEEPKVEAPVEAAPAAEAPAEEVTAEAAAPEAAEETVEAAAPEATEETVEAAAPEATEETVEAAAPEATEETVEAAAPEAAEETAEVAAPEATEEAVEAAAPEATEEPAAEEAPAAEAEGEEKAE